MSKKTVRIFVTTSHVSTMYITLMAKETWQENYADFLFVDSGTRRAEKTAQIRLTSSFHNWTLFHNFSKDAAEVHDLKPSLSKRITRRIKDKPVFRYFYGFLLRKFMAKTDAYHRQELNRLLGSHLNDQPEIQLLLMTETYLNQPLIQLFPDAKISYLEHGIGDYNAAIHTKHSGILYAVFAESYSRFLSVKGKKPDWVRSLPGIGDFPKLAAEIMKRQEFTLPIPSTAKEKNIFILMEAVDVYEVPESFWTDYMDHIFKQIDNPSEYHFLIKPHHLQSEISMRLTREHFQKLNYSYTLLDDERIKSAAIEALFSHYEKHISQVFFLFSSAGFYLSALYKDSGIRYRYSPDFMIPYTVHSPAQFRNFYKELRPMLDAVFAVNCEVF